MAVIAVWQCDRDGSMFEDKKLAEEHDKYLELAANITSLIEQEISGIDEQHSEAIGLLLAQRRDQLARACKGKPEALLETSADTADTKNTAAKNTIALKTTVAVSPDSVTALAANA